MSDVHQIHTFELSETGCPSRVQVGANNYLNNGQISLIEISIFAATKVPLLQ